MPGDFNDTDYLLHNIMENVSDNIYFKDLQSRFIMVSDAFCSWVGLSKDEVVGKTDFDLFADAHAQQAFDDEQRIIQTGEPLVNAEEKETWPDGRITWVSTTKMPMRDTDGEIIGTFGISRDITDHKETELRAAYYGEQIRSIKDRMEEDVHMASELQKTFFPRTYPLFMTSGEHGESAVRFLHHYQASGIVSGDFCSVRKLSDTEAGIFLCDVMGHGVRAALVTALVIAMIVEIAALDTDPGKYLGRLNQMLLPILRQEDMFLYATACYMVFDASTGQLRLANAGHPAPLLFPDAGEPVQWLDEDISRRDPALAIDEGAVYHTMDRTLRPGDTVAMYTDGLYETESEDGEEFGQDRLLAVAERAAGLPLNEIFQVLTRAAADFSGANEFNDDVCLVGFTFLRPL